MDDQELQSRGVQLLIGSFALSIGGLLVLFALTYATQDTALTGTGGVAKALLMTVAGTALGAWSSWLYRGSVPMVACCVAIVVAGLVGLVRVVPYL